MPTALTTQEAVQDCLCQGAWGTWATQRDCLLDMKPKETTKSKETEEGKREAPLNLPIGIF